MQKNNYFLSLLCLGVLTFGVFLGVSAQEPATPPETTDPATPVEPPKPTLQLGDPVGMVKAAKDYDLWIDPKTKTVAIDGIICLRAGQLEMFACPKGSKEHESIVAVNCKPQLVHAALLGLGVKPGTPVQFDPKYQPATGTIIDIHVLWIDEKGERRQVAAQEWIKHEKTQKAMAYDWVFAGSGFWKDEEGEHYYGDAGDFICVSNFASATLDLPVESSGANASLLFTAFTEKIPARGTKVRLLLKPREKKEAAEKSEVPVPEKQPLEK